MTVAKHEDPRPPQQRIAADIRARIMSGELRPGEQLPTNAQLMAEWSVANQTIQSALKLLKGEGWVIGKMGKGSFVRDTPQLSIDSVATMAPSSDGEPYAWIAEAAKLGKQGTNRILEVGEVPAPFEVRQAFGLPDGGAVALRKRLLLLDGEPDELVWSFHPLELAVGVGAALLSPEKIKGGTPTLLASIGFEPREMVDRVMFRPPTKEEFELLELPAEVPVGRTFRVVYADERRPIEATVMVKSGHRHQLLYRVTLPQ